MRNLILMLAIALLAFGCGRADEGASGIVGAQSGSGTNTSTTITCSNDVMPQNMRYCSEYITASGSTPQLCKMITTWNINSYGILPMMTKSQPCGNNSAALPLQLKIHDKLTISNVTAEWGSTEMKKVWGFLYVTDTSGCDEINASGMNSSSQLTTNDGFAAGLLASDGSEAFLVGTGVSKRAVTHNGQLKMGFNIPSSLQSQSCSEKLVAKIQIEHCEDISGNTYACP